MENLGIQLIVLVVMILLGIIVFKKYKFKSDISQMTRIAMFAMLSSVLSAYLTIKVPLFGSDSLRIGFAQIVLVIGGATLTPCYAFIMGIVADMIGLVLSPTTPFLGFTMNSILACLIPSIWFYKRNLKEVTWLVDGLLVLLGLFALIYVRMNDSVSIGDTILSLEGIYGWFIAAFCLIIMCVFICMVHLVKKKMPSADHHLLSNWILIVVMIEIMIQFLSTPIWLQYLWNVPWAASLFVRLLKAAILIPINSIVGYAALKVLKVNTIRK